MAVIFAMAVKDLRILLRDRVGFFFTFFFPLLMAIFFGTIFSGGGDDGGSRISVLVVDEDSTRNSRKFIARLASSEELQVEETTRADAAERVRLGKRQASIVLRKGFGEASEGIFWGESPEVELGLDPSRRAEAGMLEGILMKYAAESMQDLMRDPSGQARMRNNLAKHIDSIQRSGREFEGKETLLDFFRKLDRLLADTGLVAGGTDSASGGFKGIQPLTVTRAEIRRERVGPSNAYEISFPQGIVWGMIGCASAFGISLVVERSRGTLVRLQVAPIGRMRILAGKALACFMTTVMITTTLLIVAAGFFSVTFGSLGLLALAVLSISSAFVGIMMLLSVIGKTERSAGGIGWAALLVMSMLGGGMIPLFIMPAWMQTASNASPIKWAVLALEGAIWRGFTFEEMALPCGVLIMVGAAGYAAGVRLFRWSAA